MTGQPLLFYDSKFPAEGMLVTGINSSGGILYAQSALMETGQLISL